MKLYQPKFEELDYRMSLLCDANTMSYNAGLNLNIPDYNNDTGCLSFSRDKWKEWYDYWFGNEPTRFYSYLLVDNKFVGEVALRYVESEMAHMINIIIDSRFRGMGYGSEGLILLLKVAFQDYNLGKVIDDFPISREISRRLFKKLGFKYVKEGDLIKFSMTKAEYEMLNSLRI